MHRTNIPPQFLASVTALAFAHGTPALPLLSQSAPKPPLMAGARLPCRRRHPRLVARPAPSAPARWPRAASAETAAQLLGGRSEWVQAPRHRHPTARCPNGPPTANRPLTLPLMPKPSQIDLDLLLRVHRCDSRGSSSLSCRSGRRLGPFDPVRGHHAPTEVPGEALVALGGSLETRECIAGRVLDQPDIPDLSNAPDVGLHVVVVPVVILPEN